MPEPKLTPEGLPVVTEHTGHSLNHDVSSSASFSLAETYNRIRVYNPVLAEIIDVFAKQFDEETRGVARAKMIGIYELLRRQAEANQLENTVNNTEKTQ